MADEPTPSSSKDNPTVQEITPRSSPENLHVLRRIFYRLRNKPKYYVAGTRKYWYSLAGLHPDNLQKAVTHKLTLANIKIDSNGLDRSVVYSVWRDTILKSKRLPTTEHLFWMLKATSIPLYMDIGDFRKWLYKNGFMWKQCLSSELEVMENPEVRYQRYLYFENMACYRRMDKIILFVDHCVFDSNGKQVVLKESSKAKENAEPLQRVIFAVSRVGPHCVRHVESFTGKVFLDWINEEFLIAVGTPSVVVLTYDKYQCEEIVKVPSSDSTRRDLCRWLDYFNVPYDEEMTKVSLHDLVQKCTDTSEKVYAVDAVLKANGHTVLRIPNCIRKLTPATFYWDMVSLNTRLRSSNEPFAFDSPEKLRAAIDETFDSFTEEHADKAWSDVDVEEKSYMSLDCSVEKLLRNTIKDHYKKVYDCMADTDVPSEESDSD